MKIRVEIKIFDTKELPRMFIETDTELQLGIPSRISWLFRPRVREMRVRLN